MFDRILDWFDKGWQWIKPFNVIDAWETGAVLRVGKFNRAVPPGLHWKWPFIEQVVEITTVETTMRLPPQTLTTKDGVGVVVSAIVRYSIPNIERYVTQIFDAKDVLADVTLGAVRQAVTSTDYVDLMREPPEKAIAAAVRKDVNDYGFKVYRVTFFDLARVRSIRLIQASPMDLDN
jgi:regulator of protease activity HflC (stomatin/prohibitin superfamily)